MNIDNIVKRILEPPKNSDDFKMLKTVVFLGSNSRWYKRKLPVRSNWSMYNSRAWNLGIRIGFIHVSLTTRFTPEFLTDLFEMDLFDVPKWANSVRPTKEAKKWIRWSGKGNTYIVKAGSRLPAKVIDKLMSIAFKTAGIDKSRAMPAHPTWIYEGCGINFAYALEGSKTVDDLFKGHSQREIDSIKYRFGKDFYKTELFVKKMRLAVDKTAGDGHDDGIFYAKGEDAMHLVRGIIDAGNGRRGLLKARLAESSAADNIPGITIPEGCDGITTHHNIKYLGIDEMPDIIELDVGFVLDELHGEDDEEFIEARKLSILSLLLAKFAKGKERRVFNMFRANAKRVCRTAERFPKSIDSIIELLEGDHQAGIKMAAAMRAAIGLASKNDVEILTKAIHARFRSIKVPGKWVAVAAREDVGIHSIEGHPETISELTTAFENVMTFMRYPFTSYQSLITVGLVAVDNLPKGVLYVNTKNAKGMGLDGDDHGLLMEVISSYTGGEEAICARNVEKRNIMDLSAGELYTMGANAQQSIGLVFNAMASALGSNRSALAANLGELLDTLAQAVKKPFTFSLDLIDEVEDIDEDEIDAIAMLAMKKDIPASVFKAFGVEVPELVPAELPDVEFTDVNKETVDIAVSKGLTVASIPNGHVRNRESAFWHSTIWKDLRDDAIVNPVTAVKTYAAIAVGLRRAADVVLADVDLLLQRISPDVVIAGIELQNNPEDPDSVVSVEEESSTGSATDYLIDRGIVISDDTFNGFGRSDYRNDSITINPSMISKAANPKVVRSMPVKAPYSHRNDADFLDRAVPFKEDIRSYMDMVVLHEYGHLHITNPLKKRETLSDADKEFACDEFAFTMLSNPRFLIKNTATILAKDNEKFIFEVWTHKGNAGENKFLWYAELQKRYASMLEEGWKVESVAGIKVGFWKTDPPKGGNMIKDVTIYTDGSHLGKKDAGKVGAGGVSIYNNTEYMFCMNVDQDRYPAASNPVAEVFAASLVVKAFMGLPVNLKIVADYQGVKEWLTGNWKTKNKNIKSIVTEATICIKSICDAGGTVSFEWIKGHTGNVMNDKADEMAKMGAEGINNIEGLDDLVNAVSQNKKEGSMETKTLAVVGTAGRKGEHLKMDGNTMNTMIATVLHKMNEGGFTELVSGGAAWSDHVAVCVFNSMKNEGKEVSLTIALPCKYENGKFYDTKEFNWRTNPGGTANYYHKLMCDRTNGEYHVGQIQDAINNGAKVIIGKGFMDRNSVIAEKADELVAFTFGVGEIPKDGGTKNTWDKFDGPKKHYQLS